MPRMYGKNVALRELRWEDLMDIRAWMLDGDTTDMLGDRFMRPQTWEQTENYLRDKLDGTSGGTHFAIAEIETLKYMGEVSLVGVDPVARTARLIIMLKPDCAGRGYGTEAVRLAVKYAFRYLNVQRVSLSVQANNPRALRAYEKAGFVREGMLRRDAYRNGEYIDIIPMGILREEFDENV